MPGGPGPDGNRRARLQLRCRRRRERLRRAGCASARPQSTVWWYSQWLNLLGIGGAKRVRHRAGSQSIGFAAAQGGDVGNHKNLLRDGGAPQALRDLFLQLVLGTFGKCAWGGSSY